MTYFFKKEEINFVDHPKFEGVKWAPLIKAKKNDRVSVCFLLIEKGVEIPVHVHEGEIDSIFVLEGKGEAFVNGNWVPIKAGDYVFVPKGEKHGVRNTGEKALKCFIVHSPPLY